MFCKCRRKKSELRRCQQTGLYSVDLKYFKYFLRVVYIILLRSRALLASENELLSFKITEKKKQLETNVCLLFRFVSNIRLIEKEKKTTTQ